MCELSLGAASRNYSPVPEHGLQGTQASGVVSHGPGCSVACGIFPNQRLNPCPLHWQADSYPLHHQASPQESTSKRRFLMDVFIGTDIKAERPGHFQSPADMHITIDPFGNATCTQLLSGVPLLAPPWTVPARPLCPQSVQARKLEWVAFATPEDEIIYSH